LLIIDILFAELQSYFFNLFIWEAELYPAMAVLETLFPATVDNVFPGPKIAQWIFWLLTTVVILRSLVIVVKDDGGAQSIASVPLDSMTADGKAAVIAIFAQWGLSQPITF